jgi:hypothetical protein
LLFGFEKEAVREKEAVSARTKTHARCCCRCMQLPPTPRAAAILLCPAGMCHVVCMFCEMVGRVPYFFDRSTFHARLHLRTFVNTTTGVPVIVVAAHSSFLPSLHSRPSPSPSFNKNACTAVPFRLL